MNLSAGLFQQQQQKLQMTQQLSQAITILQYSTMELNDFLESKAMENPLIQLKPPKRKLAEWQDFVSDTTKSLSEALLIQLNLKSLTSVERDCLEELIFSLDDNGYLHIEPGYFLKKYEIGEEELESTIIMIQSLEPAGIGARSLQECIHLQLDRRWEVPDFVLTIVSDHFQAFADRKWREIAKAMGIELKEVQAAADFVTQCNPRPGAVFAKDFSHYIVPELNVRVRGDDVTVALYDGTSITVTFNKEYTDFLGHHPDRNVASYIKEKNQEFEWLVLSLRQRKQTMLKVGKAIVEKQRGFFLHGPGHLQPLTLRQIAEEVGAHESTISRAVRGKYVQTPYGVFELKSFFTAAVRAVDTAEETVSAGTVKRELQELVNQEDKRKPLSDQKLVALLTEKGCDVSRRTVAKYRDQLGIPSSSKRKRYE
ncbi:RNA polymerase factor sigma-54 [Rossellomorea marisflavi]|uniref:RNA polymerase factor sigma-54 n=1 Tax=Rossellomorea marisflavi TaxID=189381 RepID=UPI0020400730|nr:RNA polymerase factor sigma-54 [Rossellomorea marisflavi]MCM2606954.1 RNA polymerase factor sigma-54 [Rossellomorea marisflavi]